MKPEAKKKFHGFKFYLCPIKIQNNCVERRNIAQTYSLIRAGGVVHGKLSVIMVGARILYFYLVGKYLKLIVTLKRLIQKTLYLPVREVQGNGTLISNNGRYIIF